MQSLASKAQVNLLAPDLDWIIATAGPVLQTLRDSRVFISGGTGFFGRWLLESLAWANCKIGLNVQTVVLSRAPARFAQEAPHLAARADISFIQGDVRDFDFPAGQFSHIVHAATSTTPAQRPLEIFDTIVNGTRRMLDFAAACGASTFLFTSSGAVYGVQPPELSHVSEEYPGAPEPTDPRSYYGEGKRAAELLCALYHKEHGIQTKIARCFAFAGPYLPLDEHFAIGNFVRDSVRGEAYITVKGDGRPLRSYLYAADLVLWLWTILANGRACRPYNVGSEQARSIRDVALEVSRAIPPHLPVRVEEPAGSHPAQRYVPSTLRTRTELGLSEHFTLQQQIYRMRVCATQI